MNWRVKSVEASIADSGDEERSLRRSLTTFDLALMGIAVAVGAGIFSVGAQAAANFAGPSVTISFVLAAVTCGLAIMCYAEFASTVPVAGPTASALDPLASEAAAPAVEPAAPAVPLSAVAAVTGWARWPRLHPHLRRGATIPESVLRDPTLTPSERDALATLLVVTDPAELQRLLDALEVPR